MKTLIYLILTVVFLNVACNNIDKKDSEIEDFSEITKTLKRNDLKSFKNLIDSVNINSHDKNGLTLLHIVIKNANHKATELLLKLGSNPNLAAKDDYFTTPLMECTNNNQFKLAKLLLEHGADVDVQDKNGDPVINWAAFYGQEEMTELFLKSGAKTDLKSIHSTHTIIVAMKEWNYDVVDLMIRHKKGILKINESNAIIAAVKSNKLKELKELLNASNQANATDESGTSIVSIAAKNGNLELVKLLLENGADINKLNPAGQSALALSSRFGHINVVNYLLTQNADVNKTDTTYVLTPLIGAAINGNAKIGKTLLNKGADINVCDKINHCSPLIWAVRYNNYSFVEMLLKHSPDIEIKARYGFTAKEIASDSIKVLLEKFETKS